VRNKVDQNCAHVDHVLEVIDKELTQWPLSTVGDGDWLPEWLYERFKADFPYNWDELTNDDRAHWVREAAAVRRAVGRAKVGPTDEEIPKVKVIDTEMAFRHQAIADLLHKYYQAGQPMVSVRQMQDVLCGRSVPEHYESALQVLPTGVDK